MALSFYFAAPTRRFDVIFLTLNILVNKNSDLLALYFLTGVDVIGTLGLSSVTYSGVDTVAAYRISVSFFCCHTYLNVDIFFLMLFKHLC